MVSRQEAKNAKEETTLLFVHYLAKFEFKK